MEDSSRATDTQHKPPRVLIVEDEVDNAWSMASLMEELGCETRIATDGADAILSAFEFQPRIVLLDLGLPTMDGYQVAQLLRQAPELASILIIAITGHGRRRINKKPIKRALICT